MKYRVRGSLEDGSVLYFVNRSTEPGSYALNESFSWEEATCLELLLKSRNLQCRVREIPAEAAAEQPTSWNLVGRLVELERTEADGLSFPVVGCVEG